MLLNDEFVSFFLFFLISFLDFFSRRDFRLTHTNVDKCIDKFMLIIINDIRYYTFNKITRISKSVVIMKLYLCLLNLFFDLKAKKSNIYKNSHDSSWIAYSCKKLRMIKRQYQ